jgi:hypothetical protein
MENLVNELILIQLSIDKDSYEHGHDDYSIRKDINGGGPQSSFK